MNKKIICPYCEGRGMIVRREIRDNGDGTGLIRCCSETCEQCGGSGVIEVPATNGDQIRAMDDEQLAKLFTYIATGAIDTFAVPLGLSYRLSSSQKNAMYERYLTELKKPAQEENHHEHE